MVRRALASALYLTMTRAVGAVPPALASGAAYEEGDAERDRGQRVTKVVDQVSEQGDAQRLLVDERLRQRCQGQDGEAPRDSSNT